MDIKDPYWIELSDDRNMKQLEEDLRYHAEKIGTNIPVLIVLGSTHNYKPMKEVCYKVGFVSQGIRTTTIKKNSPPVFAKVLKQFITKSGFALYKVNFPKYFYEKPTMLIGLDVCHKNTSSIVGFCATYDSDFTQYYSEFFDQKKIKEIVHNMEDMMI